MKPMEHQVKAAEKLYILIKKYGYAYLQGQPRSGKTYTAILVAEMSKAKNILVLTKKKAIEGWMKFTSLPSITKNYTVTNYEQVSKLKPIYDLVIVDESHNIGSFPKPTQRYKNIRKLCWNLPHLHLSGTAIVESPASIYHQMSISKYNPFKEFRNFYDFHRKWGIPKFKWIAGREIKDYSVTKPELLDYIDYFMVYMTQEEAGIDVQVEDKVHYVELDKRTKELYNKLQKDRIVTITFYEKTDFGINSGDYDRIDYEYVADTVMKLRIALHQIEGGTLKLDKDKVIWLGNIEKIDYIKRNFDLSKKIGVMCHFKEEQSLIKYY